MLMEPDPANPLSKGFQVHIKMKVTPTRLRCLETIVEQYGCKVKAADDDWSVTIYRPVHEEPPVFPSGEGKL